MSFFILTEFKGQIRSQCATKHVTAGVCQYW
jgi:hypothetical protein